MHDERDTASRFDAEFGKPLVEFGDDFIRAGTIDEYRLSGSERLPSQAAFERNRRPLRDGELFVGEVVRVGSQLIYLGVVKRKAGDFVAQYFAQTRRGDSKQFPQIEL